MAAAVAPLLVAVAKPELMPVDAAEEVEAAAAPLEAVMLLPDMVEEEDG